MCVALEILPTLPPVFLKGVIFLHCFFSLFINRNNCVLKNVALLTFANYIKIFIIINIIFYRTDSFNDCHVLQNNLSNIVYWADKLRLKLNTTK